MEYFLLQIQTLEIQINQLMQTHKQLKLILSTSDTNQEKDLVSVQILSIRMIYF